MAQSYPHSLPCCGIAFWLLTLLYLLHAWANPLSGYFLLSGRAARSDEASLEVTAPAKEIEGELARFVLPLVAPLYERFEITGLSLDGVNAELDRMR